ncbi:hypothetical protein Ferp_0576 [Ferroglobus placidus DSM 10642]|uniref:Uncharacterized protein n=1 Tax=Ferroglobus placidus (strain DSM 10642 / AEDII12DO) TaxID=589924 RepID=D3S3B6_FERPA|nr:hypothetical protein Ferp_0576 [Ferroglobus placidus DSM 10642]
MLRMCNSGWNRQGQNALDGAGWGEIMDGKREAENVERGVIS